MGRMRLLPVFLGLCMRGMFFLLDTRVVVRHLEKRPTNNVAPSPPHQPCPFTFTFTADTRRHFIATISEAITTRVYTVTQLDVPNVIAKGCGGICGWAS